MSSKSLIRRLAAEAEAQAGEEYLRSADRAALERLFALPEYAGAKTLLLYVGVGSEPDTAPLIERALREGKTVLLPRITGRGEMEAGEYTGTLRPGPFNIPEPEGRTFQPGELDIILVPGAAFSPDFARLGRGGGYFDCYLPKTPGVRIAQGRERLLRRDIPLCGHDALMDVLITETCTRRR